MSKDNQKPWWIIVTGSGISSVVAAYAIVTLNDSGQVTLMRDLVPWFVFVVGLLGVGAGVAIIKLAKWRKSAGVLSVLLALASIFVMLSVRSWSMYAF